MKRIIVLVVFFVAAVAALPQQSAIKNGPPPAAASAPKISVELQKDLFKKQSEYQTAEAQLEQTPAFKEMVAKRDAYQAAGQKVAAVCGDKFQLGIDPETHDFACVPRPPAPPTIEKK